MEELRKNLFKILSYLQIGLGLFLVILEIRDYIVLPTTLEADVRYGGLVDLLKYKEDTYWLIPLWLLLLFSGISYHINKTLYKILSTLFLFGFIFLYIIGIQYFF